VFVADCIPGGLLAAGTIAAVAATAAKRTGCNNYYKILNV